MSSSPPAYTVQPAMGQPQPAMAQQQPVMVQPQAFVMSPQQPTTVVVVGGSNPPGPPREWKHGLCDCFSECETCLLAYVCPCVVYAKTKQALYKTDEFYLDCVIGYFMMYVGCWSCFGGNNRTKIRGRYNIIGGACNDCCIHCCCVVCALVQEKREVDEMLKIGVA